MWKRTRISMYGFGLLNKVKVKISIHEYVDKLLTVQPLDTNSMSKTPSAAHLFNINTEADRRNGASIPSPSG